MINKKTKTIIALLLAVVMCFALVGCGSSSKEPAEPATGTTGGTGDSSLRPEGVPDDFPNKEIEWIYAFGPGSPMDAYFRI